MKYKKLVETKIKNTRKEYRIFVNHHKKELKRSGICTFGAKTELAEYKKNLLEIMVHNLIDEIEEHIRARRVIKL